MDSDTRTAVSALLLCCSFLFPPSPSRNARFKESGMGFRAAGPALVKTWFSWVRGSALLRLFGFPAALLTLYLEIYGSSPVVASLIVHRLRRRIQLSASCTRKYGQDMSAILDLRGVDSVVPAQTPPRPLAAIDKGARTSKRSKSNASFTTPSHPSSKTKMPSHSRSKTASHIDLVQQGKRLSLQFPIQPAAGSTSPNASPPATRPQSWIGTPSSNLASDAASSPSDTNILAVLAAQERYVLELKEELNKAEADLQTLKKHYALHEASKRRVDVRRPAPLQPLLASLATDRLDQDEDDGTGAWVQREQERRKALLSNSKPHQQPTPRKKFSGSRHLRTLSLLSPDRTYSPSFPQPLDLLDDEPAPQRPALPAHSFTSPDLGKQVIDRTNDDRLDAGGMPAIQREKLIRAGTQMATDFKNGLFTFIEDIRQATVGDEAVNEADGTLVSLTAKGPSAKSSRKPSINRTNSKSSNPTGSFGDDFWKENGLNDSKTTVIDKKTHTMKSAQTPQKQTPKAADEDDDWISWDTPTDTYTANHADHHNSSDESDEVASQTSGPGSSRTSTRYHSKRHDSKASSLTTTSSVGHFDDAALDQKRNSTPWSDLVKLSPNNIKRTASHLMKEWEKQLTPPSESRTASHSHGDYLGRSNSPPSLI